MKKAFIKKAFILLMIAVTLAITACGSQDELRGLANTEEVSTFEQILRSLVDMQNFRAIATVEFHSNKGVNIYETTQHARVSGEYRVEVTGPANVAGSVTAFDGQQIIQFNSRVNGRVSMQVQETPERSEIFLTSFIKNYLQSDNISVRVSDMNEGLRTVFEATVPGGHHYLSFSRLWVDNSTLLPVKLIIFDQDGAERIVVTYHVFEFNVDLDDALFTV